MRHFNMTDTISHSKYSYVTHMEWKDSPLPSNKKRKKIMLLNIYIQTSALFFCLKFK